MKMLPISELIPGMTLSDAVLTPEGKVLLAANIVLSAKAIALLSTWEIETVYIRSNDMQNSISIPENILESQFLVSPNYVHIHNKYSKAIQTVTKLYNFIRKEQKIPILALKETASDIEHTITGNHSSLNYLLLSKQNTDDPTAHHGVTVAFIAGLIAKRMDYTQDQICVLTLAGLVHDIGKLTAMTPGNPDHASRGANWLQTVKGMPVEVLDCIRQHHERTDGRGYPKGVSGNTIHPYAKIITVANFYHNAACKDGFSNPFPVLEKMSTAMYGKLDPAICHTFIGQIHDCLLRSQICLEDGRTAQVIYFHQTDTHQPIVKTMKGEFIDLNTCRSIRIHQVHSQIGAHCPAN